LIFKYFLVALSIFLYLLAANGYFFLIWIAIAPIFCLIFYTRFREYLFYSLIFSVISTSYIAWMKEYNFKAWLIAATVFIVYFLIILGVAKKLYDRYGNSWIFILTVPTLFVLFQYIKFKGIKCFWLEIGVSQPTMAPLIWYIGGVGITFLIVLFNLFLASLIEKRNKLRLSFLILFLLIIIGCSLYSNLVAYNSETKIKVATIQLNNKESWPGRVKRAEELIDEYRDLTFKLRDFQPDLVIWPEYAIPADIYNAPRLLKKIEDISEEVSTVLVLGSLEWVGEQGDHTDNILVFDKGKFLGKSDAAYVFPSFFHSATVIPRNIEKKKIYYSSAGNFATNLCYEELFSNIVRKRAQKINYFIFAANNQDIVEERGDRLVSMFARLRSAENRRFSIRSTNCGYSYFISPTGRVIIKERGDLLGNHILKAEIPLLFLGKTFYSEHGNLIINTFIFLYFFILVIYLLRYKFLNNKNE